jgi:signal transduction histidine kinase
MKKNKIIFGLGRKLIIIFSLFAAILLIFVITHQYFSNRELIISNSDLRIFQTKDLFDNSLSDAVQNYLLEMESLLFRIQLDTTFENNRKQIESFILSYINRYNKLILIDESKKQSYEASPEKLFTGEYKINFRAVPWNEQSIFNYDSVRIDKRQIIITSKLDSEAAYIVVANIDVTSFLEQIFNKIIIPKSISISAIGNEGVVLFAKDASRINLHYSNLFDDQEIPLEVKIGTTYSSSDKRYLSILNTAIGINLIIEDNLNSEYYQLEILVFRLLGFSIALLIITLLALNYFATKLTQKLNTIEEVTTMVGSGNLNAQIELSSNDELGILVSSFNQMVRKLSFNYDLLNDKNIELKKKIDELVKTKNQLSEAQRLALIGETVSKISHEIQNKISGVSLWIQNLEISLEGNSTSQIYLLEIKKALDDFLDMLQNFKRFYRKPVIEINTFNLNSLIEEIVNSYEASTSKKKITFSVVMHESELFLQGDVNLLEEVLRNLIVNAIDAMEDAGKVEILSNYKEGEVLLEIHDSGKGIDQKVGDEIFSPFVTTKIDGSGLGLANVKNIISAHRGSISYGKSKLGGACFIITLPMKLKEMVY